MIPFKKMFWDNSFDIEQAIEEIKKKIEEAQE